MFIDRVNGNFHPASHELCPEIVVEIEYRIVSLRSEEMPPSKQSFFSFGDVDFMHSIDMRMVPEKVGVFFPDREFDPRLRKCTFETPYEGRREDDISDGT